MKIDNICGIINDLKLDFYIKMDEIESEMPDPYTSDWYCQMEEIIECLDEATDSLRKADKLIDEYEEVTR